MKSLIAYLARRARGRLALIPLVIVCGAFSWLSYVDGTQNVQDSGRLKSWWGWLSDRMEPHWAALADPTAPDYGSWFHQTKNIGSEWCRLDPQRGYKAAAFLIVCACLVNLVIGAAMGFAANMLAP